MIKHIYIFLLFSLLIVACDEGLAPLNTPESVTSSFLNGRIHYIGGKSNWPGKDSVFAIRIVAFKDYPPKDIKTEIITANALFTVLSLPLNVDSSDFSIEIPTPPVTYKYIVAAMQYDSTNIMAQKAVGVYAINRDPNSPTTLSIEKGKNYFIDIYVDFKNLPPQPF